MAATTSNRNVRTQAPEKREVEDPKKITEDVVEYLIEYARQNPGYAALGCLGVGFILGWKLKPW
jgi:hypothetical protein